jgi:hypothetical protein
LHALTVSAEVAAGIAAIILKGNLKEVIRDRMRDGMDNYGKNISTKAQNLIEMVLKLHKVFRMNKNWLKKLSHFSSVAEHETQITASFL